AIRWLDREMPPWQERCSIKLFAESSHPAGSFTTFQHEEGKPVKMRIQLGSGRLDRILVNALPREITHTILVPLFKNLDMPLWAREGAAKMAEEEEEQQIMREHMVEMMAGQSNLIPLRELLALKEYPKNTGVRFYAQCYALTHFLVDAKDC